MDLQKKVLFSKNYITETMNISEINHLTVPDFISKNVLVFVVKMYF